MIHTLNFNIRNVDDLLVCDIRKYILLSSTIWLDNFLKKINLYLHTVCIENILKQQIVNLMNIVGDWSQHLYSSNTRYVDTINLHENLNSKLKTRIFYFRNTSNKFHFWILLSSCQTYILSVSGITRVCARRIQMLSRYFWTSVFKFKNVSKRISIKSLFSKEKIFCTTSNKHTVWMKWKKKSVIPINILCFKF